MTWLQRYIWETLHVHFSFTNATWSVYCAFKAFLVVIRIFRTLCRCQWSRQSRLHLLSVERAWQLIICTWTPNKQLSVCQGHFLLNNFLLNYFLGSRLNNGDITSEYQVLNFDLPNTNILPHCVSNVSFQRKWKEQCSFQEVTKEMCWL